MLKVVAFMKQVAEELRMGGNFGTAHVYRSSRSEEHTSELQSHA